MARACGRVCGLQHYYLSVRIDSHFPFSLKVFSNLQHNQNEVSDE
jgi:hypothetical protein